MSNVLRARADRVRHTGKSEGAERLALDIGGAILNFPISLPLIASDS
jgi:hypothetical protein